MSEERIQKILARAGVASRRACEDLIRQGRVTINGVKAEVGAKADPARDTIRVDGEAIAADQAAPVYIALHKPAGVVSTASAQRQDQRPTVLDLVPVAERLYPAGRLDADSEGLILLTNDGDLTQRLTHPRYGHTKTYRALVRGHPSPDQLKRWAAGIQLDDGPTAPCQVRVWRRLDEATWLEIEMGEGRKRQIRRTAAALGLAVERLIRTAIGPLKLGHLKPGEWRILEAVEVRALKRAVSGEQGRSRRRERPATGGRSSRRTDRPPRRSRRRAGKERKNRP